MNAFNILSTVTEEIEETEGCIEVLSDEVGKDQTMVVNSSVGTDMHLNISEHA